MEQARDRGEKTQQPKQILYILSDFTPEAMKQAHNNNPHGLVILNDEIMAMFRTVNRYNNNSLIQDLLSVYSGIPFNVSRVLNPKPIYVANPCVNIIGTTQTKPLSEIFTPELLGNGLVDRILFVYPKSHEIPYIKVQDRTQQGYRSQADDDWREIINAILAHSPYYQGDENAMPKVVEFDEEAEVYFVNWWNGIVSKNNAIERESDVESRDFKRDNNTARMALVIQMLRAACGEATREFVDLKSVKAAITLNEYFEESYRRAYAVALDNSLDDTERLLLNSVGNTFSTAELRQRASEVGLSERTAFNYLKSLTKKNLVTHTAHGQYQKVL